ncbi:HNH endonuclease [Chryseobacterium vaccae]|uniref:HNH endonuclease n=1 Tax=Chryseobacterium vaccae TaxID=2604424 RepID=UPI001628D843|nr:hypothetical protein [Chryseobacterium vaccae]
MIYFEKSQPAPECLNIEKNKASGDYKCGDVLNRIKKDFFNKCYICGYKEPTTINVEHFRPHKGNTELKFKWENLFWSCGHCNNIKLDNYDNIIDCTDINENIEDRIKITMKPYPKEFVVIEALDTNSSTLSTTALLEAVFNGTTQLKTIEAGNLRNKILEEIGDFQKYLINYYSDGLIEDEKNFLLLHIKKHLRKSSNFTSFKRAIVRENKILKEDFEQYFD